MARPLIAALAVLASSVSSAAAWGGELAGATLPDSLTAGGKVLKLNGLGLRKKFVFDVYVGGLYLESPSKDAEQILASDQGRAIRMHFLRDLTKGQLVEAFEEGFAANAGDNAVQKAAFERMLALIPDVKEGSTMTFTYLPGRGTALLVGDRELGVFDGKGFADAVFSIWLGSKPPTSDLKKGMLGDIGPWSHTRAGSGTGGLSRLRSAAADPAACARREGPMPCRVALLREERT